MSQMRAHDLRHFHTETPPFVQYLWTRLPHADIAFVDELRRHRVLVVPGTGFGTPGHFRISYSVSDKTLEGSLKGFRMAFEAVAG